MENSMLRNTVWKCGAWLGLHLRWWARLEIDYEFEMVLELGTLVHNFAARFGQQSLSPQRPSTLKKKNESD